MLRKREKEEGFAVVVVVAATERPFSSLCFLLFCLLLQSLPFGVGGGGKERLWLREKNKRVSVWIRERGESQEKEEEEMSILPQFPLHGSSGSCRLN